MGMPKEKQQGEGVVTVERGKWKVESGTASSSFKF